MRAQLARPCSTRLAASATTRTPVPDATPAGRSTSRRPQPRPQFGHSKSQSSVPGADRKLCCRVTCQGHRNLSPDHVSATGSPSSILQEACMAPVLTVNNIAKSFAGPRVLDDVSLTIEPGEIRALVGSERLRQVDADQDPGRVPLARPAARCEVDGEAADARRRLGQRCAGLAVRPPGPRAGRQPRHRRQPGPRRCRLRQLQGVSGVIRWRARAQARPQGAGRSRLRLRRTPAGRPAGHERTHRRRGCPGAGSARRSTAKLLVLDEPTANLPAAEAERLYALARRVADSGVAVVFVSHHFDEVFGLARRGHRAARRQARRHPAGRGA